MNTLTELKPRESLVRRGEVGLSLEQAVALILGSGSHLRPIAELSTQVAQELRAGRSGLADFQKIQGLGLAKASALVAALALPRLLAPPQLSETLKEPASVYAACTDILKEPQEHLVVFFMNVRNRTIQRELVTVGTASASMVHTREVFREAIIQNAHSLILAHNHPSGDPAPSAADIQVTQYIADAGSRLGIELLDHVICARTGWYSFKEQQPLLFE